MKAYRSISIQIMLAVILTVISVLAISSIIELNVLKQREIRMLQEKGSLTADRVANNLAYPLWNLNQEETERVVTDELGSTDIFRIQVFDEDGSLYAGKMRGADGAIRNIDGANQSTLNVANASLYSFSKEINFKNTPIGSVTLEVTDANLQAKIASQQREIIIKLLLLIAVLSVVLLLALRVLVIRPISTLKSWVKKIPTAGGSQPPRFKLSGEINLLAETFSDMSARLGEKNAELESERRRLQELNSQMQAEIEERKRTEEALRDSEERFTKIFNFSPVRMGILRLKDGMVLQVNDTWLREIGFTRDEVINRPIFELGHWISDETIERIRHWLAIGKPSHDIEGKHKTKAGEERYVLISTEIVELDGEPCYIWASSDITERKRAEEALRESEARFRQLTDNIHEVLWLYTPDYSEALYISPAYETVWGRTRESLYHAPDSFLEAIHTDDRARVEETVRRENQHGFDHEYRVVRADGAVRWIWDRGFPIKDQEGRVYRIAGIAEDITERRDMEEALKANEMLFRQFIKHAPAAIAMFDTEMRYLQTSDRWLIDYHLEEKNIIGKRHYDVFPDLPDRWREVHARVLAGAIERRDEDQHLLADGTIEWLHWEAIPWRKAGGEIGGMLLFTQVITERKQAEEELRTSREQLRALSESLRRAKEEEGIRIARELHDELGSTLTSLKWSLMRLDKARAKEANQASRASERKELEEMVGLVDSTINTVRRISSELRPGVLDDLGLVSALEWHAHQFQANTGIICRFDSLIEHVDLNREQATTVFRIFQEAMTNILRHSQATKVNILLEEEENEFILEIRDNGRGITESEKLGTGSLGLLGMRERAHSINGSVKINGAQGKGTVLIVRLPLYAGSAV